MASNDRLSALIRRFSLSVTATDPRQSNFVILQSKETMVFTRLIMSSRSIVNTKPFTKESPVFCGWVEWGGQSNPLLSSLPPLIELEIQHDPSTSSLVSVLIAEHQALRCGSGAVLNRLGEILIVKLLRQQLTTGTSHSGLLGGLADARLSRAIVAIHDKPDMPWRNEDLADTAGLSMSRFHDLFKEKVGMTPMAYLRKWRMILAKQDIEKGERIQAVAKRYCYSSTEALSRSFTREFGNNPMHYRSKSDKTIN